MTLVQQLSLVPIWNGLHMSIFWIIHWKLPKYHLLEMICFVLLFLERFWILVDEEQILP